MRGTAVLVILCASSCSPGHDRGGMESSESALLVPGPITPAALPGLNAWRDDLFGLGMDVPVDVVSEVSFENPGSTPEVIKRRVLFRTPSLAHIVMDVWDNAAALPVREWVIAYRPYALFSNAGDLAYWKVGRGHRYDAVFAQTPRAGQAPAKDIVIVRAGPWIARLMYVAMDNGEAGETFRRMVSSFAMEGGGR